MIKFKVYIENNSLFHNDLSTFIKLPSVPRKGEYINLGEEIRTDLEKRAKENISIAKNYAPKWFYGISGNLNPDEITEENLKDLSFADVGSVKDIIYTANSDIIFLVLTD